MKRALMGRINFKPLAVRTVKATIIGLSPGLRPLGKNRSSVLECFGSGATRTFRPKNASTVPREMPCFASFLNELPESQSKPSTFTSEVYVNAGSFVHTNVKDSGAALPSHRDHLVGQTTRIT